MSLREEQDAAHLTDAPDAGSEPIPHHGAHAPEPAWGEIPPHHFPQPHPDANKIRILFVFAWLVVGGEETEGKAIRAHMITHVVRFDEAPDFLRYLVAERPEFLQIVFDAT